MLQTLRRINYHSFGVLRFTNTPYYNIGCYIYFGLELIWIIVALGTQVDEAVVLGKETSIQQQQQQQQDTQSQMQAQQQSNNT